MKKLICLIAMSIVAGTALFADSPWLEDYDEALRRAKAENKVVLIDFTGSDWCCWCKKLEREVFGRDDFTWAATNKFVLLRVDFPKDRSQQSQRLQDQNERLAHEYDINGFPTVLVVDANENVLTETGYVKGGAIRYVLRLYDKLGYDKNPLRYDFFERRGRDVSKYRKAQSTKR